VKITDLFVRRPVLSAVISLLILVLGLRAIFQLPVTQFPQTENGVITVNTTYYGADAQTVAGFITQPLEAAIAQAQGIDYLSSSSSAGSSAITATLQMNYPSNKALTEISAQVNAVRNQLPPQSQLPVISLQANQTTDILYLNYSSKVLPANDITEALAEMGTAAFEWKLDGARVQVHKLGDDVRVFTRNRNDVTASAPEIVEAVRAASAHALILDGEAIALRPDGAPLPFQDTMRRFGRTLDVEAMRATMPLSAFFFDCLRLDDESLTTRPASERFDALSRALPAAVLMPRIVTDDLGTAEAFYDDALARGHEGVMAKALSAPYEAGRRAPSWLKVKRLHTLDLVVLAAEWGHGRRRGFLSNLHLAARDAQGDGFVMLGKTFKGMTDELLAWQTQALLALETHRDRWAVYVRPELVVEVAFNDLQASPRYPGGLALRFARIKRYRGDKTVADADTIDTVRAIYEGRFARTPQ